jgi:hypothetical protein
LCIDTNEGTELKSTAKKYYSSRLRTAQQKRQQQSKHKNRVNIYRKYRTGELPDICITHLDIIRPLQALCLKDGKLAGLVFNTLFESLYSVVEDDSNVEISDIHQHLRKSIYTMLGADQTLSINTSTSVATSTMLATCDKQLVSCLLSCSIFCLRQEAMNVSSIVASLAKSKNTKHTLTFDPTSNQRNKRAVGASSSSSGTSFTGVENNSFYLSDLNAGLITSVTMQSMNYHTGYLIVVYILYFIYYHNIILYTLDYYII